MITTGLLETKDKEKISYRLYKNGSDNVVIIVHGFFNSKDSVLLTALAEHLAVERDVMIFDLRGHGKSSGIFTWTAREERDLEAVMSFIRPQYKSISLISFSMGGSISVNVLARNQDKVNAFVCISAPSDCCKVDFKWWKLDLENDIQYSLFTKEGTKGKGVRPGPFWLKKNKPIDNVSRLKTPVLYIHGDRDWVVGPWHSEALHANTQAVKKILIIKDGPHAEYLIRKHKDPVMNEIDLWVGKYA